MLKRSFVLPDNSLLVAGPGKNQYIDSYSYPMTRKNTKADDLFLAFFTSAPSWVVFLLQLRNSIVKLLGLKAEMVNLDDVKPPFKIGKTYGIFTIFDKSGTEVIMGTNDKHLDFRVSLLVKDSEKIVISTVLNFHNIYGRIYFFIVKYFRRKILSSMTKKMALNLELQS